MYSSPSHAKAKPGDHVVHFYRDEADLVDRVSAHVADALSGNEAALIIATEPHRRAVERALQTAGISAHLAIQAGQLTLLDAAGTLDQLRVEGQIDLGAFQRVIGGAVRRAGQGGRPVRAFGEMVDLLWRAGDVAGAIELERSWNQLLAELRFSLLCAYESQASAAPEHALALQQVCRLHTAVSPGPDGASDIGASRLFSPDRGTPGAARRFLEETLRSWGRSQATVDDARLVLSELVTNAVVHARTPVSVAISSDDSKLRLTVGDGSSVPPIPRALGGTTGRGLQIIASLARGWGVRSTLAGKTVWVDL